MTSYGICLPFSGLFPWVWQSLGPPMLLRIAWFSPFAWIRSPVYTSHIFVLWWTSRLLSCLGYYSTARSIGVRVPSQVMVFSGALARGGIVRSYGHSVFSFLRKLSTVLHKGYTSLHSHQHSPLLQTLPLHLVLFVHSLMMVQPIFNPYTYTLHIFFLIELFAVISTCENKAG